MKLKAQIAMVWLSARLHYLCWILIALSICSTFAVVFLPIVSPSINLFPQITGYLAILTGAFLLRPRQKSWKSLGRWIIWGLGVTVVVLSALIWNFFLYTLLMPRTSHQEYRSPNGKYTIILEDDFMGIPDIYLKQNFLFLKHLGRFPQAFMDGCGVEWLDEDTFSVFSNDDRETCLVIDLEEIG